MIVASCAIVYPVYASSGDAPQAGNTSSPPPLTPSVYLPDGQVPYATLDLELLQQKANSDDTAAQYELALRYRTGRSGLSPNDKTAYTWMDRAASLGDPDAAYMMAQWDAVASDQWCKYMFDNSRVTIATSRWEVVAFCGYKERAAKGDPRAADWLGRYYCGLAIPFCSRDNEASANYWDQQAIAGYMRLADAGDIASMESLAEMYLDGRGTEKDVPRAELWLKMAVERGSWAAAQKLGDVYYVSAKYSYKPEDRENAIKWYAKAIQLGLPEISLGETYYRLGELHENSARSADDKALPSGAHYKKALSFYLQSSVLSNENAILNAARIYDGDFTIGCENPAEAFRLYKQYVDVMDSKPDDVAVIVKRQTIERLGQMHYLGLGTSRDYSAAAECFGQWCYFPKSCFMLGTMYANGYGVQTNLYRAYIWAGRAAYQHRSQKTYVDLAFALEKQLTPEQLGAAKQQMRSDGFRDLLTEDRPLGSNRHDLGTMILAETEPSKPSPSRTKLNSRVAAVTPQDTLSPPTQAHTPPVQMQEPRDIEVRLQHGVCVTIPSDWEVIDTGAKKSIISYVKSKSEVIVDFEWLGSDRAFMATYGDHNGFPAEKADD